MKMNDGADKKAGGGETKHLDFGSWAYSALGLGNEA
jgi:hypothetical protein